MQGYKTQVASDIIRDGLGYELLNKELDTVAEIFRCDADYTVKVTGDLSGVPLTVLEWFITGAKERLDPFEDGTPLSDARS